MRYLIKSKRGFSLTEMMIVIICVSALAGLAIVKYGDTTEKVKAKNAANILSTVLDADKVFYEENGKLYANNINDLDVTVQTPLGFFAPVIDQDTCLISINKTPKNMGGTSPKLLINTKGEIFCTADNDNDCTKIGYELATADVNNMSNMFSDKCMPVPGGRRGCFLSGTLIQMSDGTAKPIEQVHAGDFVVSFNEKTKKLQSDKVDTFLNFQRDEYFIINNHIKVTAEHPFYLNGKWVKVKDLKIGDTLLTKGMKKEPIVSIIKKQGKVQVYNIEVARNHTFIASGIIVHNKNTTLPINCSLDDSGHVICGGMFR